MVKIVDVAARAGVSTATVSRVLNGTQVRAEMATKVRRAVEDLNYFPDRTARSLRRRHSEIIALVIPDVQNPFFTSVARGVEDVAQEAGLSVVLCNTDDDEEKEKHYLAIAELENMAGIILAPAGSAPQLTQLTDRGQATVVIDRAVPDHLDQVIFDNRSLGRRGAEMLIDRGHQDIACITGPRTTTTANERASGWCEALEAHGLSPHRLSHASFRAEGGRSAMQQILKETAQPQAVLATNNLVGVGVLQALSIKSDPTIDVAIIGDLPFATSNVSDTPLIPLNPHDMGVRAAELLVSRLHGDHGEPVTHVLET